MERTLVLMKPDAMERQVVGQIITRFERVGLKLVGMKMVKVTDELANKHYVVETFLQSGLADKTRKSYEKRGETLDKTDREIVEEVQGMLVTFLQECPILAMVWEGPHAVEIVRKLIGGTEPRSAQPGTIRGDFFMDSYVVADKKARPIRNLIHASGNLEEAQHEVSLWFKDEEMFDIEGMHDKHVK